MTVHRTAALAARHLSLKGGSVPTRVVPGRGWPLAAAAAGVAHAGLVAPDGAWPTIGLAAATAVLAAVWPWLLAGHRQDLSGALGVVWLAVAALAVGVPAVPAVPAAALLATAAGVAALVAGCSIR